MGPRWLTTSSAPNWNKGDNNPHQQQQQQQEPHRFLKANMSNNSCITKFPTSHSGARSQRSRTTTNNQPNRPRPPIRMQST
ncbi:uncharacterized protein MELLADRAFT_84658 [Melampsora larici-populina 98AG31]|uniref:Uncharacterized protein n=1 Tax=Melampsora larici-populina (strain 98AG31 / pathotype 3-4-7) TaxID=747676 RepID=F4RGD2_MELLP|nr:uncharacterized protein MELLADRAFT_84658 [Melampsora larici-populina 98AG31]EGG08484.1 hypothetical protein MELLADRAFT_84658 [Melampsora larici-populina 98AG31]